MIKVDDCKIEFDGSYITIKTELTIILKSFRKICIEDMGMSEKEAFEEISKIGRYSMMDDKALATELKERLMKL